jgi:hypothetical protein
MCHELILQHTIILSLKYLPVLIDINILISLG